MSAFKNIAPDKWKHFYVGIAMGIVIQLAAVWLLPDYFLPATILAFVIVVVISYGFEVFSKITGKGHYEILDAIAAIAGGIIGMSVALVYQLA